MRIFATAPLHLGETELARRRDRYDRICPDGVTVELHDLPPGAPTSLETDDDMRVSERYVIEALSTMPSGFDAALADCVLDPGISQVQRHLPVPVLGILRLNLAHERALGRVTAAVVRNPAIAREMRAVADACGFGDVLTDIRVLGLDYADVTEGDRWQARVEAVAGVAAASGSRLLFNGCSAVETVETSAPITVYDPVARALRLAAAGRL